MSALSFQVSHLAERQHGVVASWQLQGTSKQVEVALRGLRRVHRGVCAIGDLTELGWYLAGALALGSSGVISHLSALMLLGLRPYEPHDVNVSFVGGGRAAREGLLPHRRTRMETGTIHGIPVTSPTQSLRDAHLEPHELYRALEEAENRRYPLNLAPNDVVRLQQAVRGTTKSDAEARVLILCHEHGITLPLVNHRLNGFETDFHWPQARVVLEVDGWEFHRERAQFEEDRRRTLIHSAAGWQVLRVSALQLRQEPELLLRALQTTGW